MRKRYPGVREAEAERRRAAKSPKRDEAPDFIAGAPNYEKFKGWSPEKILVWLNVD